MHCRPGVDGSCFEKGPVLTQPGISCLVDIRVPAAALALVEMLSVAVASSLAGFKADWFHGIGKEKAHCKMTSFP